MTGILNPDRLLKELSATGLIGRDQTAVVGTNLTRLY